jgi:hypothetical protein
MRKNMAPKVWREGELEARAEELLKEEEGGTPGHWFLSFAADGYWRGCIIQAPGFTHAYVYSGIIGCRGRGEVMGIPIPIEQVPPLEYRNRLLTKEQFEEFWGPMKTEKQWDKEHDERPT